MDANQSLERYKGVSSKGNSLPLGVYVGPSNRLSNNYSTPPGSFQPLCNQCAKTFCNRHAKTVYSDNDYSCIQI